MKDIKKNTKKVEKSISNNLLVLLILIATLFMSVGYATINNVILSVSGSGNVAIERSVHITVATSAHSASTINSFSGTMLNSTVDLTNNNPETFTITINNNTTDNYIFDQVLRDTEQSLFYDNQNITFSLNGLNRYDTLNAGQSVTFTITFDYVNGFTPSSPSDKVLNSYINFKFRKGYTVTYNNIDTTNKNYPTVALEGTNFEVSFYGDIPYDVKVTSGSTVLTENTHYTYGNDPNNNGNKLLTINNVTNNITIDRYYHITYVINGNATNNNPDKYLTGNEVTFSSPTLTGYLFDGWYQNSGYTGSKVTSTNGMSGDLTLYAKMLQLYYITYELNSGTNPNNQVTEFTLEYPQNIANAYHTHDATFDGWYQNSGLTGTQITSTSSLSGNSTLYAKWISSINNATFSTSTGRFTASNVSSDSLRNFHNRQYTRSSASVDINSIKLFISLSAGNKSATLTCQVTSNSSGFTTVSDTVTLTNQSNVEVTFTLTNPILAGSNYTISCPSHTGDNNGKYKITGFSFLIN